VGVLLLNLGGPDTLDDVQPFLYNLFADPDIIRYVPIHTLSHMPVCLEPNERQAHTHTSVHS
jgi:protoheme ferro-lyase